MKQPGTCRQATCRHLEKRQASCRQGKSASSVIPERSPQSTVASPFKQCQHAKNGRFMVQYKNWSSHVTVPDSQCVSLDAEDCVNIDLRSYLRVYVAWIGSGSTLSLRNWGWRIPQRWETPAYVLTTQRAFLFVDDIMRIGGECYIKFFYYLYSQHDHGILKT